MKKEYIEMVDIEYQVNEQDKRSVYKHGMARDMLIEGVIQAMCSSSA